MKRPGLIGGTGWPSTLEYYRLLNIYYGEATTPGHSLDLVLRSLDFEIFRQHMANDRKEAALKMLSDSIQDCEKAGADFLVFTANGLHRFLDELAPFIHLPIVHIADATAQEVADRGIKKVGLMGVRGTMESDFYQTRLQKHGVTTVIPDETDREVMEKIIFSELVQGKFTGKSKAIFIEIMKRLTQKGVEGIILGCTEIPLLVQDTDVDLILFPTTEIHCKAVLQMVLKI